MAWTVAVSFAVGALCGLRVPVLIFALLVLLVMSVFVIASIGSGHPALTTAMWVFIYGAVLEAGYVLVHGLLYLFYVKGRAKNKEPSNLKIRSKFPRTDA